MNFSSLEFVPNRQRGRQWIPLITQQFRLRHLSQLMGLNLFLREFGSFYFTLHSTPMSAPFYTSEKISNPHPRWKELDFIEMTNESASCIVVRVWHHCINESDQVVLTWGIHFSGLVYIGNKIAEIQPLHFKTNSVIFCIFGGYYTSLNVIRFDKEKSVPFLNNLNAIDILDHKVVFKRIAVKCIEIQSSYSVEKLRKIQNLQIEIKRKSLEVQNIQDKIHVFLNGNCVEERKIVTKGIGTNSPIRYAPQLLTMNSLNKMLKEKPTTMERQEMFKIKKQVELIRFKTKLLSQEKDKKSVNIRQLKQKFISVLEGNEEKNTILMENFHKLAKGTENLREYKKDIINHKDILSNLYCQLQYRKKQLLQQLLFIYPIKQIDDIKYTIYGIYFPSSDKIADSPDIGLSVALGYITHVLTMCSKFLQIPLRYPLTHYGSRSYVTDHISPSLPDREREFPLFTRGKDKVQFTYAVYLLNKNIAQFRWLLSMNTYDLKATLANLLTLLQIQKDSRRETSRRTDIRLNKITFNLSAPGKYVGLHSFGSNSSISDPILDWLRHENHLQKSNSPTRPQGKKSASISSRISESGRGLTEILTIPEAYLNKQIGSDSLRNFIASGKCYIEPDQEYNSNDNKLDGIPEDQIKITSGREISICNITLDKHRIEEGTDTLDPRSNLSSVNKHILICDNQLPRQRKDVLKQNRRRSRSVDSYSDEECRCSSKPRFELGSEPLLNTSNSRKQALDRVFVGNSQEEIIQKWLENTPCSNENNYPSDISSNSSPKENNLLTARTDALLTRKTFNLVKPKP